MRIPPLRERTADIPLLIAALVEKYAGLYKKQLRGVTDRALQMLLRYPWPGNIRELENVIERGVLLAPAGGQIEIGNLFADIEQAADTVGQELNNRGHVCSKQEDSERRLCEELLSGPFDWNRHEQQVFAMAAAKAGGNLAEAARRLGVTRRQLAYRLQQTDEGQAAD